VTKIGRLRNVNRVLLKKYHGNVKKTIHEIPSFILIYSSVNFFDIFVYCN